MVQNQSNIILIGMPGSGKSTVGIILAKMIARDFVDTDVIIQISQGRSLQDIVNMEGHMVLRQIEEDILLNLKCFNHVIATGGSAIYSHSAMNYLKSQGDIVFLDVDLPTLRSRIHNFETRGLAKQSDQTFTDLFEERGNLYKKYADFMIDCSNLKQEEICSTIIDEYGLDS